MTPEIIDCRQGSAAWFHARLGIPTASNFQSVISKGKGKAPSKMRRTYLLKLTAERIMGEISEHYKNEHMERGNELEPFARTSYQIETKRKVVEIGFMKNLLAGYSPDGLVDDDGSIEIKCRLPHIQLETILSNVVPSENIAQIQGGLWVSERKWCDYVSYCKRLPLHIIRVYRDEEKIQQIEDAVRVFNYDIEKMQDEILKLKGETI